MKAAAVLLASADLQSMLATLELDHPARQPLNVTDGIQGMKMLGVIEGYQRCLDLFRSMGTSVKEGPREDVQSTFGARPITE